MGRRYVFLGGMPRSGTTWLMNLVGSTPGVIAGRELHLFDNYASKLMSAYYHEGTYGAPDGISPMVPREKFIADFVRPLAVKALEAYEEHIRGSESLSDPVNYVVEKTPSNALHWRLTADIFPSSKRIFIVRDPRSVVSSFKAAGKEAWGAWARRPVEDIAVSWLKYSCAIKDAFDCKSALVVRFEDLVERPQDELKRIFAYLEWDCDDSGIEAIVADNSIDRINHLSDDDWRSDARPSFRRGGSIDSWKQDLSDNEVSSVEFLCGGAYAYWKETLKC